MQRKFLILILLTIVFVLSSTISAMAVVVIRPIDPLSSTFDLLEEFCNVATTREIGSQGNQNAALFIYSHFSDLGLTVNYQNFFVYDDYGREITVSNVIAKRQDFDSTKNKVVIGAHYDSIAQGANDNASGVVALLKIAEQLEPHLDDLDFEIEFIAFTAEEVGLLGSEYYVSTMSDFQIEQTLMMINIDSIATGDKLYLYCEDKNTNFQDFFIEKSEQNSISNEISLLKKPIGSDLSFGLYYFEEYGYYQTVHASDHTPFRVKGIPTAFFFSGVYDGVSLGYAESDVDSNFVMNTNNDTLTHLRSNVGQVAIDRIDLTIHTVVSVLTDEQSNSVLVSARDELLNLDLLYNSLYPSAIALVLLVGLTVWGFVHYRKLKKQAILGYAETKQNNIFQTPEIEDIFTFKD